MIRYAICLLIFVSCVGAVEPIFYSESESEPENPIIAPTGLIEFILHQEDSVDKKLLRECMEEENIKRGDVAALFSVFRLSLNSDSSPDYFVRPALKPFCSAFYGAHMFRYWFVSTSVKKGRIIYRVVFKSGGDGVGVLPTRRHGYNDLLLFSHSARSQYWVTLTYDAHQYKEKSCELKEFQEDGSLKNLPCQLKK